LTFNLALRDHHLLLLWDPGLPLFPRDDLP
jgi:hypothetical protein